MYGIWLAKQMIGICATHQNMARIGGWANDRCPNCLCGPEQHDHLARCINLGRTALFEDDVNNLHMWMTDHSNTDEDVAFWIHKYLLLQGEYTMSKLGGMSMGMLDVAAAFDEIGWVEVLHDRIPIAL
jgi:hypothetical protein